MSVLADAAPTPPESGRSAGRPRAGQRTLDRTHIGAATVEVLCSQGLDGLSVSRVAKVLGVRSQSLYHHISGVADLIDTARSVLISGIDMTSFDRESSFEVAVERFAESYTRSFLPLKLSVWAFFQYPIRDAATIGMYEAFLTHAEGAGVPQDRALNLLFDLEYAAFMVVYEHASLRETLAPETLRELGATRLEAALNRVHPDTWEWALERLLTLVRRLVRDARADHAEAPVFRPEA